MIRLVLEVIDRLKMSSVDVVDNEYLSEGITYS